MRYIESVTTDPCWNLALEEYAFAHLTDETGLFMLWRNHNAIIVGKHQNTFAEVNAAEVKQRDIKVVRRLSGGGAVYHDLGNINFTFVLPEQKGMDFAQFCRPVQQALCALGVTAEISGRNDMTIEGKKFSGNSQYRKKGKVMHHGTLLFDSNLHIVSTVLQPDKEKLIHKGLKSVRSRVTNIKPYLTEPMETEMFLRFLQEFMSKALSLTPYSLSVHDVDQINQLSQNRYQSWDWNYGTSPAHSCVQSMRFAEVGKVEAYLSIQNGRIQNIRFYGDFFELDPLSELEQQLTGCMILPDDLSKINSARYIKNLHSEQLIQLLLEN